MRRMARQGDDAHQPRNDAHHRRDDAQHHRHDAHHHPQHRADDAADLARHRRDDPHYHGHRDRLRARFSEAGGDALPDYELLEIVLFRSIPRRDVKPIAKELIRRFGTFAETPPRRRG
jgi:hypothetical protein